MRRVTFAFIRQICSLLDSPFSQKEKGRKHKGAGRSSREKLRKPPSTATEMNSCQEEGIIPMLDKHLLREMC